MVLFHLLFPTTYQGSVTLRDYERMKVPSPKFNVLSNTTYKILQLSNFLICGEIEGWRTDDHVVSSEEMKLQSLYIYIDRFLTSQP